MKKENRKENYKKSTYYKNREEQNHNTTTQCKPHIYANKATVIKGLKSLLVFLCPQISSGRITVRND